MNATTTSSVARAMRNTRPRTSWTALPTEVRAAIESVAGHVKEVRPIEAGLNSGTAALLRMSSGNVFIKGLPGEHRGVAALRREAEIAPHVADVSPRLRWQVEVAGWFVLGFEPVDGRHADLTRGSRDLPVVAEALQRLGTLSAPDVPLKRLHERWSDFGDDSQLDMLRGEHLLHTDLNPHNILISDSAYIVDWAWPTLGPAWVDPACAALWLIAEGHSPAAAEAWAAQIPAWGTAAGKAVDTFTAVSCRLWKQIADADPQPWKVGMHSAAQTWARHRATVEGI